VSSGKSVAAGLRRGMPAHLVPIKVDAERPEPLLTREQAAAMVGIHPRTLDRWIERGRVRIIDLRGTVRVPASEAREAAHYARWTRFV
jgi:excisionase family DNA binding protein